MSLARVKVWSPGDVLTADDLNGEFNNVLNNPITLISPTTAAINFGLQAHTGLLPSVLSASSGSTGSLLAVTSSGAPNWLANGSTGQVLTVSSSGLAPIWGVVPPDGGLSTGTPSTGALYYVSTDGKLVPLAAGTSGQVLTISTAGKPSWAAASASGGGSFGIVSGNLFSTVDTWWDDFQTASRGVTYANTSGTLSFTYPSSGTGLVSPLITGGPAGNAIQAVSYNPFTLARNPIVTVKVAQESTSAKTFKIGLGTSAPGTLHGLLGLTDPTDGLYFRTSASSTWVAVSRQANNEFTINTTAVGSTEYVSLQLAVSNGGTTSVSAAVYANGTLQGTFTATQLTTEFMNFSIAQTVSNLMRIDGWQVTQDRPSKL